MTPQDEQRFYKALHKYMRENGISAYFYHAPRVPNNEHHVELQVRTTDQVDEHGTVIDECFMRVQGMDMLRFFITSDSKRLVSYKRTTPISTLITGLNHMQIYAKVNKRSFTGLFGIKSTIVIK